MNDTHGVEGEGWYGFDLDGTLARYDGWKGIDHIGLPIWSMTRLMRRLHDEGKVVKIVTARVAPKERPETKPNPYITNAWCIHQPDVQKWAFRNEWTPLEFIQEWCYRFMNFVPEVVYQKDHLMLELYDDRVKQVVPNAGVLVEDQRDAAVRIADRRRGELCDALTAATELRRDLRRMKVLCSLSFVSLVIVSLAALLALGLRRTTGDAELEGLVRAYIEMKGRPTPAEEAK